MSDEEELKAQQLDQQQEEEQLDEAGQEEQQEETATTTTTTNDDLNSINNFKRKFTDNRYDLFATVNHYGAEFGGHYTAFVYNKAEEIWYVMDDERVQPLAKEHPIITQNTYMCFYQRKGLNTSEAEQFVPEEIRETLKKVNQDDDPTVSNHSNNCTIQ